MTDRMTADDILPLVVSLPREERVRLIRMIGNCAGMDDASAYRNAPPHPDEFGSDSDSLGWDAEGWEEFS